MTVTVGAIASRHGIESVTRLADEVPRPSCNRERDPAVEEIVSVETLRLRRIQQPSKVERLLDAYISRSTGLPQGSYQIRDPSSVPSGLQQIVSQATEQGKVWSCWSAGSSDTWLFTCEMSMPLSRKRGTPVLQVCLYNNDGSLKDSDSWTTDPEGTWQRSGEPAS